MGEVAVRSGRRRAAGTQTSPHQKSAGDPEDRAAMTSLGKCAVTTTRLTAIDHGDKSTSTDARSGHKAPIAAAAAKASTACPEGKLAY